MRHPWRLLGALTIAFLAFALPAAAVPDQGKAKSERANKGTKHDFRSPMQKKYDAALKVALQDKVKGKANGKVHAVNGQFVQLAREGTDRVFVVIAEFGNARHSSFCDPGQTCAFPPDGSAQRYNGPLHNEIDAAESRHRQLDSVAGRLQQGPLREHVLQPDVGLLRASVLEPLLGRR